MAVFDGGVFDIGVFDVEAAAGTSTDSGGGGSKRYWDWIRGRKSLPAHIAGKPTEEDVRRIRAALTGKKRKPIEKQAEIILRAPKRDVAVVEEILPDRQAEAVVELRETLAATSLSTVAAQRFLAEHAEAIEQAHAALLAVREAKARAKALRDAEIEEDDALVLELFMERKRRLAAMAVELMQKRRAS